MKKALGKGLSALIPDTYIKEKEAKEAVQKPFKESQGTEVIAKAVQKKESSSSPFQMLPIAQIRASRNQPRKEFNPEAIEDLAASIEEKGILQPIIVRRKKEDEYEIVCGERRFRAATLCGLDEIPAVIKDLADIEFLEWALIENIQREDLNPLEEAEAYQRLAEEHKLSQEQIAKQLGKSRVSITNTLRLLRLPMDVRAYVADGLLTAGHARALLSLMTPEHQRQLAKRIVEENLSVRQTEALTAKPGKAKRKAKQARNLSPEVIDLENRLMAHIGSRVRIIPKKNMKQGRLEIQYLSLDDLDRILERMQLPQS